MQTIDEPTSTADDDDQSLNHEEIATLVYQFWEERGHDNGNHEDDWARAEKQIRKMQEQDSTVGSHVV
jgi:hypothetical protein